MIAELKGILQKTYDNPILRKTTVPLILSNPGLGKTTVINEFAQERGVKILETILSTRMPNEVAGGIVPNYETKCWEHFDYGALRDLQDGDIWFLDEIFNGTLKQTLDALLNVLESRNLLSGIKLKNIMIIGASNPQNIIALTPQIKQRFNTWYLKFNKDEYCSFMKNRYGMPPSISSDLAKIIEKETFENKSQWNYNTPRSFEKAINQIGCDLPNYYDDILLPYLKKTILCPTDIKEIQIKENDEVEYLTILKHIVALRNKEEILKQNK